MRGSVSERGPRVRLASDEFPLHTRASLSSSGGRCDLRGTSIPADSASGFVPPSCSMTSGPWPRPARASSSRACASFWRLRAKLIRTFPAMAKVIPKTIARDMEGNPNSMDPIPLVLPTVEGSGMNGVNGMAMFARETNVCVGGWVSVETRWFCQGTRDHNVWPDMWWVADRTAGSEVQGNRISWSAISSCDLVLAMPRALGSHVASFIAWSGKSRVWNPVSSQLECVLVILLIQLQPSLSIRLHFFLPGSLSLVVGVVRPKLGSKINWCVIPLRSTLLSIIFVLFCRDFITSMNISL